MKIAGLLKAGYTRKEIAAKCGVCDHTINRVREEFGGKEKKQPSRIPEEVMKEWDFVRRVILGEIKIEGARR